MSKVHRSEKTNLALEIPSMPYFACQFPKTVNKRGLAMLVVLWNEKEISQRCDSHQWLYRDIHEICLLDVIKTEL